MLALPDRHGFRGRRLGHSPSFAGRSTFRGVVACTSWPRARAATCCPPGFEPAPAVVARDDHPVLVLFGEQSRPALLRAGLALPMGPSYGELGVFVPYVRAVDCRTLCTLAWRMWSTYSPAVWEGNHRYFAKAMASMRSTDELVVAADGAGRPLLHAVVAAAGEWRRPDGLATLDAIRDAFALPVLGVPAHGRPAVSYFDWDFAAARVRPVQASIWIAAALAGDAAPCELQVTGGDAVAIRDMAWRLSWPGPWATSPSPSPSP